MQHITKNKTAKTTNYSAQNGPDAGTGLLSPLSYKRRMRNITSGKSDVYVGLLAAAAMRGFKSVLWPTAAAT